MKKFEAKISRDLAAEMIHVDEYDENFVYIAQHNESKKWCIASKYPHEGGYHLKMLDDSITIGNGYGADARALQTLINDTSYFMTFYQFPDFRSAMEYYLEQSK